MNLALIGVGLIGGSFARAVRAAGRVNRIVGFDTQPEALQRALELGVIDDIALSAAHAVANADLVMIATPVGGTRAVLREIAPHLRSAAIITDVGSTKTGVIEAARAELAGAFERFVPAHPIAGSERSGLEHSDSSLFRGTVCIITLSTDTDLNAVRQVESLWNDIGCTVEQMSSEEHDHIFAAVSHLPHLLAFAFVAQIASDKDANRKFAFADQAFATSPASRRRVPRCGATSAFPTALRFRASCAPIASCSPCCSVQSTRATPNPCVVSFSKQLWHAEEFRSVSNKCSFTGHLRCRHAGMSV